MVEVIDQRGEEIQTNVEQAQEQIGQAVEKARSRRRKKWWCLLVVRKFTPRNSIYILHSFITLFSESSFITGPCPPPFLRDHNLVFSFILANVPGIPFPYRASHAREITCIFGFWEDSSHHRRRRRGRRGGHANAEEMKTLSRTLDNMAGSLFLLIILFTPMKSKEKNLIMETSPRVQFSPYHYCYRCDRAGCDEG